MIFEIHVGHHNIIKYCPWNRPWDKVEDMNLHLLDTWNSVVRQEDTVYFLGDFAMKHNILEEYLPRLNGRISIICGNHDKMHPMHKGADKTTERLFKLCPKNLVEVLVEKKITLGGFKVLLNHFPWREEEEKHSAEHSTYVDRYTDWKPSRRDNPSHRLLFGHKHSKPENRVITKGLEISFDSWGRMVSEEDILAEFRRMKNG